MLSNQKIFLSPSVCMEVGHSFMGRLTRVLIMMKTKLLAFSFPADGAPYLSKKN